jgi:diguanylate cyclase (GGDEF)-like protein
MLLKASTLLGRFQLFRNVEIDSISDCISQCSFRELKKDEMLLSPDEDNTDVYVMISGRLVVYLDLDEAAPLTLVEPGECVGEMSIIEGKSPSAYVIASEASQIMQIPQEVLWQMIHASHQVTRNMLHIMSLRVRFSNVVISDSLGSQKECMRHAMIDSLTGLHNRRWMDSMFEQELIHARREKLSLTLMMLDIDYFKNYNDEYGHVNGDRILSVIADALRGGLRPNDMIARYGGEEFAVMLPETTLQNALALAELLRKRVEQVIIKNDNGESLPCVTISIGVSAIAETTKANKTALTELISAADEALYRAKNGGRNCVSQ